MNIVKRFLSWFISKSKVTKAAEKLTKTDKVIKVIRNLVGDFHYEIILWHDNHTPDDHDKWHDIEPTGLPAIPIVSIGMVVEENGDRLRLLQNMGMGCRGCNEVVIEKEDIDWRCTCLHLFSKNLKKDNEIKWG
jgi:hypothetical protein